MTTFEQELSRQAATSLGVTERILRGEEIGALQGRTAISMISNQIKHDSVQNGRISRVISLVKLGVRDEATRERIARVALDSLLPGALTAGPVEPSAPAPLAP